MTFASIHSSARLSSMLRWCQAGYWHMTRIPGRMPSIRNSRSTSREEPSSISRSPSIANVGNPSVPEVSTTVAAPPSSASMPVV